MNREEGIGIRYLADWSRTYLHLARGLHSQYQQSVAMAFKSIVER